MDTKTKKIIKYTALILCMILLIILGILLTNLNKATEEPLQMPVEIKTPELNIIPETKIIQPTVKKNIIQQEIEKEVKPLPLMRDENDMPKSDVNVPEIG